MEPDFELDGWRREWQAGPSVPANLIERVEHETRRMRYFLASEILVTVIIGGGSLVWAAVSPGEDRLVLATGVWTLIAIAWLMSWVLRRGAWSPLAATTTAFVELSILRCRRRREAIIAQAVLYVLILSFDLWFIRTRSTPHAAMSLATFLTGPILIGVWLLSAGLAVFAVRQYRRLGEELEALLSLQYHVDERTIAA